MGIWNNIGKAVGWSWKKTKAGAGHVKTAAGHVTVENIEAMTERVHDGRMATREFIDASKGLGREAMSPVAPVARGIKKGIGKGVKAAGWTAAIAAAVGGLAILTSGAKKSRKFDPRTEPLPENDTPQLLTADAMNDDDAPARTKREVLGPMTAKVLGRTGGGMDVTPPNTVGSDGASLIDGKQLKDLGSVTPSLN